MHPFAAQALALSSFSSAEYLLLGAKGATRAGKRKILEACGGRRKLAGLA